MQSIYQEELAKERRNLILLSCIIILSQFLRLKDDTINLLGNSVIIDKPEILTGLIIITWSYFLLRFYQGVVSKDNLGEIKTKYRHLMNKFSKNKIDKLLVRRGLIESEKNSSWNYSELPKKNYFVREYSFGKQNNETGEWEITHKENLNIVLFSFQHLKTIIYITFNTRKVTEFIFPFFIALIALFVVLFNLFQLL